MQNKLLPLLIISLVVSPAYAYMPKQFESIYIQEKGSMISLDKAILEKQGTIESIVGTNNYNINFQGKKYRVNLNSKAEITNTINFIFPGKIMVNISFVSSVPNNEVYFDGSFINEKTDGNGNADITGLYPKPGNHRIELKNKNIIRAKSKLRINTKATVQCTGAKNMVCKIIE
ncbi:hypothetical protein AYO45_01420 [Gammaproteobacteria bacterium SCGC AG-212-F23]|nr:hypothetical protein AYO45_01420 [Gammaproteobacteria bacterium SCGC AG-212-F23]